MSEDRPNLTDDERSILDNIVAAWGKWCDLPDKHPSDVQEFGTHIHALQNMVAWRVARRVDPEIWFPEVKK